MGGEGDDAPDAHPAVAKFRYRLEWKADQVADPYSPKCVEGCSRSSYPRECVGTSKEAEAWSLATLRAGSLDHKV